MHEGEVEGGPGRKSRLAVLGRLALLACGAMLVAAIGSTIAFHFRPRPAVLINPFATGLQGQSCDRWSDAQGIVHLRSSNRDAAIACLGLQHGLDRAWQLDYFKRTWQGRLSEVLGPSQLRQDFSMRLFGLQKRADALFEAMSPDMKSWLWSYAEGINRGVREAMGKGVYEFKELGYAPEPWRPQDSVALLLLQAFDQTKETFLRQLEERDEQEDWGEAAPALFAREGVPWDTTILKEGEYEAAPAPARGSSGGSGGRHARSARSREERLGWLAALQGGPGLGSNNWVLAPARSRSGHAWLANDPHLDLKYPPFWYWAHLESPGFDVIGASLPGVPGFASATNRHVAWGLTNSYLGVALLAAVPERELAADASSSRPWIWFKWGPFKFPFFAKTFQRTSDGWPVLPLEAPAGRALVLRWTGFELAADDFRGVFDLMSARDAREADAALGRFGVPSWNFVFADTSGKIGYRAVGRVPSHAREPAFGIPAMSLDGLRNLKSFARRLDAGEMPHVFNPARGYVATANNRQWPDSARWHAGRGHSESFRAFRIEELLLARPRHDLESISRIQCDTQAVDARFLLPAMMREAATVKDPRAEAALAALGDWDRDARLDCRACPVFQRWLDRLLTDEDLDDTSLYRKLKDRAHPGLGDSVREALVGALGELGIVPGEPLPTWEQRHLAFFPHLSGLFPAEGLPTPGDDQSVDPGSSEWDGRYFRHTTGASQRLVVELSDPPRVYSVLAGPNVDLPREGSALMPALAGSPWRKWRDCELARREFPLDWSKVRSERVGW